MCAAVGIEMATFEDKLGFCSISKIAKMERSNKSNECIFLAERYEFLKPVH
jgi:hypothetical protein